MDTGLLAAQRRAVYQRLDQPVRWWNSVPVRRWTAGMTTARILAGSLALGASAQNRAEFPWWNSPVVADIGLSQDQTSRIRQIAAAIATTFLTPAITSRSPKLRCKTS